MILIAVVKGGATLDHEDGPRVVLDGEPVRFCLNTEDGSVMSGISQLPKLTAFLEAHGLLDLYELGQPREG